MSKYNFTVKLVSEKGYTVEIDVGANYGCWERPDGTEGGGLWFVEIESDEPGGKPKLELTDYDGDYELDDSIYAVLKQNGYIVPEEFLPCEQVHPCRTHCLAQRTDQGVLRMNYTRMERHSIARAFALVRENMAGKCPQSRYICVTLSFLQGEEKISDATFVFAKGVVMDRLDDYETYERWMCHNHEKLYWKAWYDNTINQKARAGRIAWLDSLIKEFSE